MSRKDLLARFVVSRSINIILALLGLWLMAQNTEPQWAKGIVLLVLLSFIAANVYRIIEILAMDDEELRETWDWETTR